MLYKLEKCNIKYWISAYKFTVKNNQLKILAVYRSPRNNNVEFCQIFEEIIKEICEFSQNIIMVGDFNIDWSKQGTNKNRLKCTFSDNGLKQIINDYTRVTASTKTIIDYVITNKTNITSNNNISNKITDHEAIGIKINKTGNIYTGKMEIKIFKYNKTVFTNEICAILGKK